MRFAFTCLLGLMVAGSAAAGTGSVKGRFVLDGTSPKLEPLVAKGEPVRDAATCSASAVPNQTYVVSDKGGIANIVVYLKKAPKDMPDDAAVPPSEPAVFDQKGCVFEPHVLAVQAGRPVTLKSSDPVAHNVRISFFNNPSVNQIIPGNGSIEKTFELGESAPSSVACDIHPYMIGYVMVTDHPYVAVTDADGNFEIKNLPEGEHEFRVWHEASGYLDKGMEVEITADEETDLGDVKVEEDDFIDD